MPFTELIRTISDNMFKFSPYHIVESLYEVEGDIVVGLPVKGNKKKHVVK